MTKDQLIEFIGDRKGVSFVEVERRFPEIMVGQPMVWENDKNWVYWEGWNADAWSLMHDLKRDKVLDFDPCSMLIYLIDGKALELPMVKSMRSYKTPHWMPLTMCLHPEYVAQR